MAGSKAEKSVKNQFKNGEKLTREEALAALKQVLVMATSKLASRYTPKPDRLKWSRIVSQAAAASTGLLRDEKLEDLEERLTRLEEREAER